MSQKGGPTAGDSKSNPSGKIEPTNTKTEKKQDNVPELEKRARHILIEYKAIE